jgi:hypothetical protein
MSVCDVLQDWKELVTSAMEVKAFKKRVAELEAAHDFGRIQFEKELEELEEEEREAILAVMAVYEQSAQNDTALTGGGPASPTKSNTLNWLVNKVGNEGVDGISWTNVLNAWNTQYPDASTSALYTTLNQHQELFAKKGLGKRAVLRLTNEGQALFRQSS